MSSRRIYVTLPVLNESTNLPALVSCMQKQRFKDFSLIACVNNYDHWWEDANVRDQCIDNQQSLDYLRSLNGLDITVIDSCSKGNGWSVKKGGVGWARKVAMDHAAELGADQDLIISIDADTYYPENFFDEVKRVFELNHKITGLAIPYYHQLAGDETDRLILRYEIYMRHFLLNMLLIRNPYAFTAIGSAMACTLKGYNRIGGITPVKSGEDFYFIQKLVKNGNIGLWVETVAYPSPRFSDRVLFGTGPALIKGSGGDWDSYPLHPGLSFEMIQKTFDCFPELFEKETATTMDSFFKQQFRTDSIWAPLRRNYKDMDNFVQACIRKVDGLRILQFLRKSRSAYAETDAEILQAFLNMCHSSRVDSDLQKNFSNIDFQTTEIATLNEVRDFLFKIESKLRKERDDLIFSDSAG